MPSTMFAALALQATAAADVIMAEGWTLTPMMAAPERTAAAVPDAACRGGAFVGTFVDPEAKPDMANSYDRRQVRRPGERSGKPRLLVSPAAVAASGFTFQANDLLTRAADGVTWSVASVFAMAGGTVSLDLNLVG